MQSYLGGTNQGSCTNYGYKTLSAGDNLKRITSGNNGNGYGDNERCYWGIYAPGAQKLRFQLTNNLHVSDQNIFLSQD